MDSSNLSSGFSPTKRLWPIWLIRRVCLRAFTLFAFSTIILVFLLLNRTPNHHAPLSSPTIKTIVHGKVVKGKPEIRYPLKPFPESAMQSAVATDGYNRNRQQRPWLAAVICAASDMEQRLLIRTTWMRLFEDVPFDGRFVVSNPGPRYTDMVIFENRTFGDIIVLDHLQEDDVTANTIKTLEFYKWLVQGEKKYEFVSKMDTDLWLNARGFWDQFLVPRLTQRTPSKIWKSTVSRTIIGELYYSRNSHLVFPQGGIYTTTWDMVELLVSLQTEFQVVTGEDMAISILMHKGSQTGNFVNFRGSEKFDYSDGDSRGDGTAWARPDTHPDSAQHAVVGPNPIAIHQLKDKRFWHKVADCFDSHGIRSPTPARYHKPPFAARWFDFWYSLGISGKYTSRINLIPENLWSFQNGRWICDGIWNLGETRTGFSDVL
ncbi:hypothetical protein CORC01_11713 [Colletotrichum orchidophilum]|uniref:Hexosyltransferase n=1 Tax=Colletotrichum orchidophilum TaxID=1209926 RepID=A0A1G4AUZ1_9PEZI|nr:uncharacterized protein CORC01_11713 [Colletotrichum orchidophilum]OHE92990.1 hypothetical protein CORC01_11713 [Colletotrichum orchidophilum]